MDILKFLRIDFQELTADQFLAEMIKTANLPSQPKLQNNSKLTDNKR